MNLSVSPVKNRRASIHIKRAYEVPGKTDGVRVLVDRLWPRGRSKADLHIDLWLKGLAPSDGLRKWFDHDPVKWQEFQSRYRLELAAKRDTINSVLAQLEKRAVTLVFAAHDAEHNNAVVLADFLRKAAHGKKIGKRK